MSSVVFMAAPSPGYGSVAFPTSSDRPAVHQVAAVDPDGFEAPSLVQAVRTAEVAGIAVARFGGRVRLDPCCAPLARAGDHGVEQSAGEAVPSIGGRDHEA